MSTTLTLLDLAGAVALLLWGLHMVQTGVQRAFGDVLRRLLVVAMGSRLRAFGCGLLVTAVLQSSTAAGLMVSGFAGAGLVALAPGLAAMLGANVGTTLIVQVLAFDVSPAASLAVLLGVMMFRRSAQTRTRDLGRVAIGLGLMLTALHTLLALVTPFEDAPSLRLLLGAVATEPVLAMLAAAVLAWAAHSSVAAVLLVMSFAARGVVPPHEALAMVLGANLGTAINPLLEGAGGEGGEGRRLPLGNFVNRAVGCVLGLALLDWLGPKLVVLIPDPAREVAVFHTGFNLVMALLFLPVLGPLARLLQRLLPARGSAADPGVPVYLGAAEQETPGVALAGAAREALRMADALDGMLAVAQESLDQHDRKRPAMLKAQHVVLERLFHAIRAYVAELDPDGMSDAEVARARQVVAFAANLEAAAGVLARSVAQASGQRLKRGVMLQAAERAALHGALGRLTANLRTATGVFMAQDAAAARMLVGEKEAFRALEAEADAGIAALHGPDAAAAELNRDLMHDLKRLNGYLVAAAAYPVLEAEGALRGTRLRDETGA